ncbi:hypothetical protein [Aquirhabdus parva]|uniref:Uncharacterized protein n=1 Tax=Aquirhabdus parva TaxID=2283318 RepID=A0A345P3B3_9GAMM|nr:hypothetical protein [Aquirhabdus parva]AXI01772.1 hypothetical protein HYN46_02080 [Aquirhabdus parva]
MNTTLFSTTNHLPQPDSICGQFDSVPDPIKKTDILQYYRETKQGFLNLGSMLIGQHDRKLYIFSTSGALNDIVILEA